MSPACSTSRRSSSSTTGPTKPVRIWSRLGRRPWSRSGNSNGDIEMLRFARSSTRDGLRILLRHDDADRETAYDDGAEDALARAADKGWTVVSMRDDWSRVFPEPLTPPAPHATLGRVSAAWSGRNRAGRRCAPAADAGVLRTAARAVAAGEHRRSGPPDGRAARSCRSPAARSAWARSIGSRTATTAKVRSTSSSCRRTASRPTP